MQFSESNTKIATALTAAWGAIENPKHNTSVQVKTKSGSTYTFDYTDLGGIFDEAKKVLKVNGLSVLQNAYTERLEGTQIISVETMLLHNSGEWVKSSPLSMVANPNIQEMGGQITYMKRYSLSALLGIATEKDDDANAASGNEVNYKLSDAQVKRLFAIANSAGVSPADVKKAIIKDYKKTAAEDLTKQEYDSLCKRLENAAKEAQHAK